MAPPGLAACFSWRKIPFSLSNSGTSAKNPARADRIKLYRVNWRERAKALAETTSFTNRGHPAGSNVTRFYLA